MEEIAVASVRCHAVRLLISLVALSAVAASASAQALTIYEVQYTTNPDGTSDYDGQVVDCMGGIVVGKFAGFRPRIILQDPNDPDGWGAIQAKDWTSTLELFDNVQIGDWVEFTNMLVEDFRGTTMLQWQTAYDPGFTVVSQGNPLPPPVIVSVADVPAPIEGPVGEWYVENHEAEPYESMRLIVRDVTVTQMDLGKAVDNYNLETPAGQSCWAADYMNEDVDPWGYHPFVDLGQHFCAVAGVFEQYTRLSDGWDYYQLITQRTADLAICGDGDSDGDVDLDDLPRFAECLVGPLCAPGGDDCDVPAWTQPPADLPIPHCLMVDVDYDRDVDLHDFDVFQTLFGVP
jgi:hypothetical protein